MAAGWLWILFSKLKVNSIIALPIVGFAGAMVNTITVMGSIYILFCKTVCRSKRCGSQCRMGLVMGTVTASGIPEAIAAAILVLAIGKSITWCISKNEYWKCCESKCIEERRPSGSRKRAGSLLLLCIYKKEAASD